jgi:hypothetical protein
MVKKHWLILSGLAVLTLLIISSCSLASQDVMTGIGVSLYIDDDSLSRYISAKEFDVTSLDIAIKDGDTTLFEVTWTPYGDWNRKFIPLLYGGSFDIEVTHHGEKAGETVSVTESAKFRYNAGIITIIRIVPGMVGVINIEPGEEPVPVDVTGNWDFYYSIDGEEEAGPEPFFLDQSGEDITAAWGIIGTISGSTLTLRFYESESGFGYMLWIGDLENGTITGDLFESDEFWNQYDSLGTFRLVEPSMPEYGRIDMSGTQGIDENWNSIIDYEIDVDLHTDYGVGYNNNFNNGPGSYSISYYGPGKDFSLAIDFTDPNVTVPPGSGPVILSFPEDFRISLRYIQDGVGDQDWWYGPPDWNGPEVMLTIQQLDADRFVADLFGEYPFELTGSFDVGLLEPSNG